ncbi:phosphotransferase family protein [Gordonia phosphorivorans]|uniref:phosphotransferase family protein n=1 Tax=Gordonia phosphorivorans TaxID=1056982 RepID=UPI00360628B4
MYAPDADPIACVAAVRGRLAASSVPPELDDLVAMISTSRAEPSVAVRVHGSSDPSNILLADDGTVTLLDWEASRLGPPAIDRASITFGLLVRDRPDLAEQVMAGSVGVAGFLVLRLLYLHSNGALRPKVLRVARDLLHDFE